MGEGGGAGGMGATRLRESLEAGVGRRWRTRRGRDALLCTTDTCQRGTEVGGGGFREATQLFGSSEKHVNTVRAAVLTLAWPQCLAGTR